MKIEYPLDTWKDYEILDSGRYEKLERFGSYVMARPEPKALWDKTLSDAQWDKLIHTRFTPGAGFGRCGEGYFRLTAFGSAEATEEAVGRLEKLL